MRSHDREVVARPLARPPQVHAGRQRRLVELEADANLVASGDGGGGHGGFVGREGVVVPEVDECVEQRPVGERGGGHGSRKADPDG